MEILEIIKKKQNTIVIALFIIGFSVSLFLAIRTFINKTSAPTFAPTQTAAIQIDFQFLDNQILEELELFEGTSIPEDKGRENPFLPYQPGSDESSPDEPSPDEPSPNEPSD